MESQQNGSLGQPTGTNTNKLSYQHLRHSLFIKQHRQIKCSPHIMRFIPFCDWSQHKESLCRISSMREKLESNRPYDAHRMKSSFFSPFHVVLLLCLVFRFRFKKVVSLCRFPQNSLLSLPVGRPSCYNCAYSYGIVRSFHHITTYIINPEHHITTVKAPSSCRLILLLSISGRAFCVEEYWHTWNFS